MKITKKRLVEDAFFKGIGIHTGEECSVSISNHSTSSDRNGIWINDLLVNVDTCFYSRGFSTACGNVSMIEHLMGFLILEGITDVNITVKGPEIPILDGGALQYHEQIKREIVYETPEITQSVSLSNNRSIVSVRHLSPKTDNTMILPDILSMKIDQFEINANTDQILSLIDRKETCIYASKTFIHENNVDAFLDAGFGKGAIGGENHYVYKEKNDFNVENIIGHKLLDFFGDIGILLNNNPFNASFYFGEGLHLINPGHEINLAFVNDADRSTNFW